ncbi:MAG: (Fe-S)-binding protein [Halodesulfovibrio sp.]
MKKQPQISLHHATGSHAQSGQTTWPTLPEAAATAAGVSADCSECMACVRQCAFLDCYGTPKALADAYAANPQKIRDLAFECSLCGLCTTVCPDKADPATMFLALRRESTAAGETLLPRYKPILGYEKLGNSPFFSCYSLPEKCDTIFFPGCTLPGKHPHATAELFAHIRRSVPAAGIVLDCCNKPSHDLGRQDHFETMFGELLNFLMNHSVRTVLVACPNCHKVFSQYAPAIRVKSVYEFLHENGLPDVITSSDTLPGAATPNAGTDADNAFTIHDPCPLRAESGTHDAVRALLGSKGIAIAEMRHNRKKTLCCGEGGTVAMRANDLALAWGEARSREAQGKTVVTYCAGCANYLGRHMKTIHILDMLFPQPETAKAAPPAGLRPYFERLKFKRYIKSLPAAVYRERPMRVGERFISMPRLDSKKMLAAASVAAAALLWLLISHFA